MKNKLIILSLAILLGGCGQDKDIDNSSFRCGIVSQDKGSFSYRCTDSDKIFSKIPLEHPTKEKQVCEVDFRNDGQLNYLKCSEMVEPISTYISNGAKLESDWQCTGLDGYGGYLRNNISQLSLSENGTYQIHISGKENSDSVWFVTNSIISGSFQINNPNILLLTPKEWRSNVINSSGLTLESAPKFMMVKEVEIKITNLTKTELHGKSTFTTSNNHTRKTNIKCKLANTD